MRSPLGSPVAQSQPGRKSAPAAASSEIAAATVSLDSSRSSRVSNLQLTHLSSRLSRLDITILHLISEVRIATGNQLRRRFWPDGEATKESRARMARRTLRRLTDWRLLEVLPRRTGGVRAGSDGFTFYLGSAGRRLLAREGFEARRLSTPSDRFTRHTLSLTELVIRLHEADRDGRFELVEYQTEPRCWRGYIGPWGSRQILKPDLHVRLGVGAYELRAMIEVDLATESKVTIARKAWRYVNYYQASGSEDVFPVVVWAVPDGRRATQITEVLAGLPTAASKLFIVVQFDHLIDRLAEEARA